MEADKSKYCKHHDCVERTVEELKWLASQLPGRKYQLLDIATVVVRTESSVRCKRGFPEPAPLPKGTT